MDKLLGSLLMVIFVANLIWIIYIIIKEYKKALVCLDLSFLSYSILCLIIIVSMLSLLFPAFYLESFCYFINNEKRGCQYG